MQVYLFLFLFFFQEKYVWTYSDVMRAFPPGFQVIKVYIINQCSFVNFGKKQKNVAKLVRHIIELICENNISFVFSLLIFFLEFAR